MHILFITGEYPPIQGGVGAYTFELGQALMAMGAKVSVLTSNMADSVSRTSNEVMVYRVVKQWNGRIWPAIRKIADHIEADWVHIQYQTGAFSMHPAINFAPFYWRKLPNRRVAWTYHDMLVPYLFPKAGKPLRSWVTEWPTLVSDLIITTNYGDWEYLQPKLARRSQIQLAQIPIGSNIKGQHLDAAQRQARRQLRGYGTEQIVLAYFGFLNQSKGGLTLVRTLHLLIQCYPNVLLLMIGERVGENDPTNFAYLQEVEYLITELGLERYVQWTGYQSDGDVGADLNAADFLVMLYEDGASLRRGTLMAGLANGCAIITTEPQAPLPELVDGRDLSYVAPNDPQATAEKISTLILNPVQSASLRRNARERSKLFNWQTIAQQHIALYESPGQSNRIDYQP